MADGLRQRLARTFGFGRTAPDETKASRTARLIALSAFGQAVWSPRDASAFAREGFAKNPIVYRSVRMIAEAAASVPLYLYEGEDAVDMHPLLALISKPNGAQSTPELLEATYGHLLVAGNAYLEAVSVGGEPRELHVLRPDRMKIVPGVDGWPEAYDYSVGGETVRFVQDVSAGVRPILHLALFHPLNDHYGMSPLEPAAAAIDIHNQGADWNKALLDNAACPSGALVYSAADGQLAPEQYERLKTELEDSFSGARNAGRPLLLEGGLDWKGMGFSPKDMDFIQAKHLAAREIALSLGVPPMLLGIPGDNTYSNYQEANRTFWRQTVLPLVNRTAKALSGWLGAGFEDGLELRPDLDAVEALSVEREALWERVRVSEFLTVNEKRAAVGYGPVEGGDVL
ncbi:Phage portal protein [Methyloligella halotolerans]|uniref:Phage portal protein n=1 Tax=Methyloligella halotolerans TaxID=1177755 RepID=A0A1E2RX98_9HYPH|nr:phage portal protein [Methyloligella halotolerans]ODA66844.1 Phage portal protein [Methyloligella halotolerans]